MRVLLFHPEWSRSCSDCVTWLYDDDGKVSTRCDVPNKRPKGVPTPCFKCPKIPHGMAPDRQNAVELTDRNFAAYVHYLECRAVDDWPKDASGKVDPIVRRNARILRAIQDEADQKPLHKLIALVSLGNGK